ncbi:MAG: patatin-like phospholipase family protein [Syntrophobacteraceae bacterium]|jgi:NTE family protein
MSRFKSALVLSGGSARALSHLGVIQEIERRNLKFDLIVGTSMGAVIGGMYACFGDSARVIERLKNLFESELFLKTSSIAVDEDSVFTGSYGLIQRFMWLFRQGVFYTRTMLKMELVAYDLYDGLLSMLIPEVLIEDLPVPFAAVAMDLRTGEEIVLTKGSLRRAIAASSSIPGIFPPIRINERMLVDGGWADNVPAVPAIVLGAHFVLAVDATLDVAGIAAYPKSAMGVMLRCDEITRILLNRHRKSAADVLIVPETGDIFWADFKSLDYCLAAGRKVFQQNAPTVYNQLLLRRFRTLKGAIHPGRTGGWKHPLVIV